MLGDRALESDGVFDWALGQNSDRIVKAALAETMPHRNFHISSPIPRESLRAQASRDVVREFARESRLSLQTRRGGRVIVADAGCHGYGGRARPTFGASFPTASIRWIEPGASRRPLGLPFYRLRSCYRDAGNNSAAALTRSFRLDERAACKRGSVPARISCHLVEEDL